MRVITQPQAREAITQFELPKLNGFGGTLAPIMATADFDRETWSDIEIVPYGPISMQPTCKVLHYGQEIFEGMKAYSTGERGPFLFRPDQNAKRFNFSARRMAMPEIPEEIFIQAVKEVTRLCANIIPRRSGESLYIRPFMFATEQSLGIKPAESFKFIIIASPSSTYFEGGTISVLIERDTVRACPGGTGNAKTGGNYAASLKAAIETKKLGHHQTLWLDAITRTKVEEMSGMNFACIMGNKLVTPSLTNTILPGITRDSLLTLAAQADLQAEERTLTIDELTQAIKSNTCKEAFACGTAAAITPIHQLAEKDGTIYKLAKAPGPASSTLREALLGIQEGRAKSPKDDWIVDLSQN